MFLLLLNNYAEKKEFRERCIGADIFFDSTELFRNPRNMFCLNEEYTFKSYRNVPINISSTGHLDSDKYYKSYRAICGAHAAHKEKNMSS